MKRISVPIWGALGLAMSLGLVGPLRAADEAGDELVQMIVTLVSDKDRDMRTVGLQQVREEAKGPKATRRFAALLPKLSPDAQVGLLDALSDRGDAAARPSVVEMLKSPEESVRAAALRALGSLADAADVPLLVQPLAGPAGAEKAAAHSSLARLRGQAFQTAMVAQMKLAKPAARAELLGVLAARRATDALPAVLAAAEDGDAPVRMAALTALRVLAGPEQTTALVKLLKAAKDDQEQYKAEMALMTVCNKGKQACAEPVLAGMTGASPTARAAFLRALARAGGDRALATIVAATKDPQTTVRETAVRLLAYWPDAAAVAPLKAIALEAESVAQQALAVQGIVRLASPSRDRRADLALLCEAMKLARRPEEKRMVLGILGGIASGQSLALVVPVLDDAALADEACLAVVLIAEKLDDSANAQRRAALEKARDKAHDPQIRERIRKALASL